MQNLITKNQVLKDNPHAEEGHIKLIKSGKYGPETIGSQKFTKFAEYCVNSQGNHASYVFDENSKKWFLGMN